MNFLLIYQIKKCGKKYKKKISNNYKAANTYVNWMKHNDLNMKTKMTEVNSFIQYQMGFFSLVIAHKTHHDNH